MRVVDNKRYEEVTDQCQMLDLAITPFPCFATLETIQQRIKDALVEKISPAVFKLIKNPAGHITWVQQVSSLRASI